MVVSRSAKRVTFELLKIGQHYSLSFGEREGVGISSDAHVMTPRSRQRSGAVGEEALNWLAGTRL